MTNPFHIHKSCNDSQELSCVPGQSHCFHSNKLCVFEFHQNAKILKHCRNGAHLFNCTKFQCAGYFKCPMSYCVPFDLICNGEWECPQGDDEIDCKSYSCPNLFKCKNQSKCLHFSKFCDNNKDCIFGDDESWCTNDSLLVCPKKCKCFAQSLICNYLETFFHHHTWNSIKYLKFISCDLQHSSKLFSSFHFLMFLNIKNFLLDSICIKNDNMHVAHSFRHFDISSNRLTKTNKFCFITLNSLKTFHLQKNSISNLEDNSFYKLLDLDLLDLSCNKIINLKSNSFNGLKNIKAVNLTFNLIMFIDYGAFKDVSPNTVHSFNLKVCCIHGSWAKCKVKENTLPNCDDLLSNKFMKSLSFVMGNLLIFLNIISFFLNIRMKKLTQNICSAYLAFIDWCFGVYLLIIAIADMDYKGNYIGLEMSWRSSLTCKLTSLFAFVSMTVSPIILCIMMISRFCVIQWPVTSKFKDKTFVK